MTRLIRIWRDGKGRYIVRNLLGAERTELVYDIQTKIVYYLLGNGAMSPYLSGNGKFCRFVDNQIVEIN